jgi:uncharacterized membrane protein HdeD (DUF308 family)
MSVERTPTWLRFFQIIAGIIAMVLSGAVLASPVTALFIVTLLFSIALIFLGIERIIVGITSSGGSRGSRIGNIVLGVITITISGLPMIFPLFAFEIIVFLISFGLLFNGIGRIMQGVSSKTADRWYRVTVIGFGIFAIVFSVLVLVYPILSTTIMLSVVFLILGIECIMAGTTGQRAMNLEDMKRSLR